MTNPGPRTQAFCRGKLPIHGHEDDEGNADADADDDDDDDDDADDDAFSPSSRGAPPAGCARTLPPRACVCVAGRGHGLPLAARVLRTRHRCTGIAMVLSNGMDWNGLDWIGMDWIGLDWVGLGWIGLDGLDWMGTRLDLMGLDQIGLHWDSTGFDWTA